MADSTQESKSSAGRSTLLWIIVAVVVLAFAAFLLLRPGGSGTSSGVDGKPTAPVAAH